MGSACVCECRGRARTTTLYGRRSVLLCAYCTTHVFCVLCIAPAEQYVPANYMCVLYNVCVCLYARRLNVQTRVLELKRPPPLLRP